jgi:hypothetical protein
MSQPNKRRVRMEQFTRQIADQVLPDNNLVPVDLPDGQVVHIKIPVMLPEGDDFLDRMTAAGNEEDIALVIFSGADVPAEDQWRIWRDAGYTGTDLIKVFTTERLAAEDRLRAFRYKG